jgi:pimeloyl-ACP methyl ester carboxylesterase
MRIAPHYRLIGWVAPFIVLASVYTSFDALAQQEGFSIRAPDAFYDPPAKVTGRPGTLLRSEPLKDVTLPADLRGWRIKCLDSVRAARNMPELELSDRAAVWGHSQGGQSALWTGIIGSRYAPEVKIVGVAAIAPAADMKALLSESVELDHRLGPYMALSYSRFYPDIKFEQAVRPEAFAAAREMVNLCGFLPPEDAQKFAQLLTTFAGPALATATDPVFAARIAQNTASKPIAAPLLIAQGLTDSVVVPAVTDRYVDGRCYAGQRLEYWKFADHDHTDIVRVGSKMEDPLIAWTAARFSGESQPKGCGRKSFRSLHIALRKPL